MTKGTNVCFPQWAQVSSISDVSESALPFTLQNLWLRPRSSRRRRRRRQGGSEAASNGCDHYEQYAFASYDVGLCDTSIYAMKSYTLNVLLPL